MRSVAYATKGEIDRAICDLDEAIRLDPKDADFIAARGHAHFDKADYDCSIADFDEAVRLNPNNAHFFQRRGSAYTMKGQHHRAIADFDQAIRLDSKDATFIASRGKAYENCGDYDHAICDYDEATRLKPNYYWAINNRAKIVASKRRWEYFRGKPNTNAVLEEKATVVTHLIVDRCDAGASLAVQFRNKFPDTRLGEHEVRRLAQAEIAAFLYCLVARLAASLCGQERDAPFDTFMTTLATRLASTLQNKGTDPQSFEQLLGKRYKEYSHYQIRKVEENESMKGELFWEFGKKISTVLRGFEHPVVGIPLATLMLEAFVEWKGLRELLRESK